MIRKLSVVALAAAIALSATGCSFSRTPDTLQSYAPSDGVGADIAVSAGNIVKLRNIMYITNGTRGALYGVIVNQGTVAHTVTLQTQKADGSKTTEVIDLPVGDSHSIGLNGNRASLITSDRPAGATFEMSVKVNDLPWQTLNVPVLDDTFAELQPLIDDLKTTTRTKGKPTKKQSGN